MLFCIRVNIFRKEFLIEYDICKVEYNILLYIVHKTITIILISNEYHQFSM